MSRPRRIISIPPTAVVAVYLGYVGARIANALAHGDWPKAVIQGATAALLVYLLNRIMRKPREASMSLLSRDQILGADDRKTEDVPVPEWGGTVRMRTLTAAERDEFENGLVKQVGNKQVTNGRNARAKLVALCAVGEDGLPLFTKADVIKLGSKSSMALQRLYDVACRMNGFSDEDMEALTENFGEPLAGPSPSASPSTSEPPASTGSSAVSPPSNSPSGWHGNGTPGPSAHAVPTTMPH